MRALVGGVIGAAASAAVWKAAEHFGQTTLSWLVILVGLVTGYCVHRAGGTDAKGGFLRGALAIVLTLAAILGGQKAYAMIMQATSTSIVVVAKETVDDAATKEDDSEDADAATNEPLPPLQEAKIGLGKREYSKSSIKKNLSEWDMLWMCVAALAAYMTGKGGDPSAAGEAGESVPEPQDSPENAGE